MTTTATLHVLRVFCAADGSGGNELGVFLDGAEVADADRQPIAGDLGFAETVFVDDRERGELRIFTPEVELPLAGHPLVGAAWLLRREGSATDVLRPPPGEVPVRFEGDLAHIAADPDWGPPFELAELERGASGRRGRAGGGGEPDDLGVARRAGRADPRAGLRARGRDRRGRGDRVGGAAARSAPRPRARDPPGPRLGALRAAAGGGLAEVGGRVVLEEVRRYPVGAS